MRDAGVDAAAPVILRLVGVADDVGDGFVVGEVAAVGVFEGAGPVLEFDGACINGEEENEECKDIGGHHVA